ncbi:MAG: thioredoxin family protein [Dichotomicrobium sp.]
MPTKPTRLRTGAVTLLIAASLTGVAGAAPQVGTPAPAFTATDTNGKTHSLGDFRGKTVVLEWTNHGCPYVRKHYDTGNMQALQEDATEDGMIWLSVISSAPGMHGHVSPERANELTETRDASPSAVLLDPSGEVGKAYGARTTPHMYIIDPDGTLMYMGAIDDRPTSRHSSVDGATNYVREALTAMENGEEIAEPVTRAYGCSVKYGS